MPGGPRERQRALSAGPRIPNRCSLLNEIPHRLGCFHPARSSNDRRTAGEETALSTTDYVGPLRTTIAVGATRADSIPRAAGQEQAVAHQALPLLDACGEEGSRLACPGVTGHRVKVSDTRRSLASGHAARPGNVTRPLGSTSLHEFARKATPKDGGGPFSWGWPKPSAEFPSVCASQFDRGPFVVYILIR